jgi:hypothetical protein
VIDRRLLFCFPYHPRFLGIGLAGQTAIGATCLSATFQAAKSFDIGFSMKMDPTLDLSLFYQPVILRVLHR